MDRARAPLDVRHILLTSNGALTLAPLWILLSTAGSIYLNAKALTPKSSFLKEAEQHDLCALKGHRSVGGFRASIYNAMPVEGVKVLCQLMDDFRAKNA